MKEDAGGGHEVDEAFANECCLERRSVSHVRARGEGWEGTGDIASVDIHRRH
jgi:hypothetical protein